ncbi:MAG: leucine-rich repeat protein [Treponema sp.]|nr:leucine-rich repeat protein [Treponema sp.]
MRFFNCSLTGDVVIPASVTKIGKSAFAGCINFQSVTFDDPVGWYDYDTDDEIDVSDRWSGIYKKTT